MLSGMDLFLQNSHRQLPFVLQMNGFFAIMQENAAMRP